MALQYQFSHRAVGHSIPSIVRRLAPGSKAQPFLSRSQPGRRRLHAPARLSHEPNPTSALLSCSQPSRPSIPAAAPGSPKRPDEFATVQLAVADALSRAEAALATEQQQQQPFGPAQLAAALSAIEGAAQQISGRESLISPDPTKSGSRKRSSDTDDGDTAADGDAVAASRERTASSSFARLLAARRASRMTRRLTRLPQALAGPIEALSDAAYRLVTRDGLSALTPSTLQTYTNIQCLLQKPESLAEVFELYSEMPNASGLARRLAPVAVDPSTAFSALNVAIQLKNAPLAIAIIDASLAHRSFWRSKFIREALPPLSLLVATPAVLLPAAHRIAAAQANLPPATASRILFAGAMTYFGVVSSLAYVTVTSTVTTANREVDGSFGRVSWAPGTPLWRRWIGEHERLGIDKVVSAWGFADDRHWGGEEGQEWQDLKEVVAMRGMEIDANS